MSALASEHPSAEERPQGWFTADDVAAALQISKTLVGDVPCGGGFSGLSVALSTT
jgi:hypothetical protein